MKKKEIGKVFPNLNRTVAYYSPISLFITLNEVTESESVTLFADARNMKSAKNASIYLHEIRHNLDHISTLWGQKNLLKLAIAINARISNSEFEFHKIMPLKKEENQFHYDEYYTEHQQRVVWKNTSDNWIWDMSSGIKFNIEGKPDENFPIIFIKFYDRTKNLIVRVPLSIAALLETNAVCDEINHVINHINKLPKEERVIENMLFSKSMMEDMLYNQEMAVYNSIVHLTANILKLTDLAEAIKISSAIAALTLNLTNDLIKNIPIESTAKEYLGKRTDSMIQNHEYGFVFYNLLINYAKTFNTKKVYVLDDVLASNNLPSKEETLEIIIIEFETIKKEFGHLSCLKKLFVPLLEKGIELLKIRGIDSFKTSTEEILKDKIFEPNIIFADTDFEIIEYKMKDIVKNPPQNLTAIERYSFMDFINFKLDEFFAIRGL